MLNTVSSSSPLPISNLKPIQILVVDDHFMVRMGLSASLNVESDMEVVAEAANCEAALSAYRDFTEAYQTSVERKRPLFARRAGAGA